MAEFVNSKRVFLPKGKQNKFIKKILSGITVKEAAKLCNLSERTIRDWRREKFSMDLKALRKLCLKTNIPLPFNIELKNRYWYVHLGASTGGKIVWAKYGRIGDPEKRKKKWYEWWKTKGRFMGLFVTKPIKKPRKSKELAEFAGIMIGDGGITKNQVTITLHYKDDREYGEFVIALIKNLFNVPVGTSRYQSAMKYNISRTKLVRFCVEKLGLKQGNKIKQKVDIAAGVKQNKLYSITCVRGLIDTDGCIFTHCYKVNGKWYSYKKLAFTSYSKPLRQSVFNILKNNGLNPRLAANRDVRLDSIKDMNRYFQIIGSHNPKHLKRYLK